MEKRLFEYFKDSFRLGAAVGGILYDYEGAVKKHEKFLEFIKTHPKPEGIPDFKIPSLPKGPFIESDILAKHFNLQKMILKCAMFFLVQMNMIFLLLINLLKWRKKMVRL